MALGGFGGGQSLGDPLSELRRMQAEMDRLLSRHAAAGAAEFPLINLWSNPEGLVVMAWLPGISTDDVELVVQNDTLTIRGERRSQNVEGDNEVVYHRRERPHGVFGRTIVLPYEVEADSAEAILSDGVLAVRVKRPEAERPKRIDISVR